MNTHIPTVAVLVGLFASPLMINASELTFDDLTSFNTEFPIASRSSAGGDSSVSLLTSPDRVNLHAQQASGDTAAPARMTIYSTTSADYDFLASEKTFTFSDVGFNTAPSGATYTGVLGVFAAPDASGTTVAEDGVFFLIDRGGERLRLNQRYNGNTYVLQQWTGLGSSPNAYSFSEMQFTLTASSWSITASALDSTVYSSSGLFSDGSGSTTLNGTNWGDSFYLGLESQMTNPNLDTSRFLDLSVESIAVIPEPASASLLLTFGVLAVAGLRRRR